MKKNKTIGSVHRIGCHLLDGPKCSHRHEGLTYKCHLLPYVKGI